MKRNYITLLLLMIAAFCIAAAPYGGSVNQDGNGPIFGHWKTNTDTTDSTNYVILNFTETEMQAVYYADNQIIRKGVIDVWYSDSENKVKFVDKETTYDIHGDTLYFSIKNTDYMAMRIAGEDVPENNDDFSNVTKRAWPKKGIVWLLSWFE
ncbi:MAG: hypothetical protein K6F33_12585 [Bacteroidales bacterium]|nr:hypothetical protein [Bacteroidales bacterium]